MLHIWMPESNGEWQWSNGGHWQKAESLEQLIQDIKLEKTDDAVVYFPSREVQIVQQQLSKAQYKQLASEGIKYLLEEYVIIPVEQMKVFSYFLQPDQVSILGIANNAVITMQHALTLLPVKVVALLPDFLMLPIPEKNQIVLANINGHLLVRENEFLGNSIDDLALYLDYAPKDRQYMYSGLSDAQVESLFAIAPSDQRESFVYELTEIKKPKQHPYNVLPKAKTESSGVTGYWKACAVLVVALIVVQLSYDTLRWMKLKKIADQTAMLAVEQYQSWFGRTERTTEQNVRSNFQSRLNKSQTGDTQALQLLSRVGPILMQHQIIANQVNYEASMLNMDLVAKSSDSLQTLVQQLNQQGFKAELGNVQTQGTTVIGLVKIQ